METIGYKVNDGKFKIYGQGKTSEVFKMHKNLMERSNKQGFKIVCREHGNMGVQLTLKKGETTVVLYFFNNNTELDLFNFFYNK